ncbi:IclR family transcriptional regulator [Streptomyces sp. NPDC058424]|uniref:IclR family transcriptional regulator n=1 Tax=Streptomyces sp. NPDC058424 TaxID=3346491 RepID=UPI00365857CB
MSTSVVRAMRVLELLAHAEKPLPLTRIAEALDIPKSTAHSILRDLVSESFVEVGDPPAYSIGLKAFEVGAAHLRVVGAVGVVVPELVRLTSALNITSHYAVLDHTDAVYLCKHDPPGLGVRLASSVGARLPSHITAVGKACLAWLDDDRLATHVAPASRSPRAVESTLKALRAELDQVREQGFATDDEQTSVGIHCVAAPVFDTTGCRGAIGVSYLEAAVESLERLTKEVKAAAARASAALGGQVRR